MSQGLWEFWIDRGGTFTDLVARRPDGSLATHKILSVAPEQYRDAAVQGIRELMDLASDTPIQADQIRVVKMGTTVATNALLERCGARTVLVVTKGFRDALRIAYQNRPRLFDRHIILPEMLYEHVIEVDERVDAEGNILASLDIEQARADLALAHADGVEAVAIVFMHGYRYPDHERRVAALADELGFGQISTSHETSALIKYVARGDTSVVDAYLSPILRRYVDEVATELKSVRLMFMQSSGGLTDARHFRGKDAVLSGPAGGIVGAAKTSSMAGFTNIISFDMGGTSTDVAHFSGAYERTLDSMVAGIRIRSPMLDIHTVAAGGGSVCSFDGARYRVGPQSAGADPGPASYRRGGPLTVTDCNIMLGRLRAEYFPALFGSSHDQPLDEITVREKFAALAGEIEMATGDARDGVAVAQGFLQIAVENMANAIKKISVEKGHDVTEYTLCCFGGAGGQHACAVADTLGMTRVIIHPFAGVLSAYGMGLADIISLREISVEQPLNQFDENGLAAVFEPLLTTVTGELAGQGVAMRAIETTRSLHIKYDGSDSSLVIDFASPDVMARDFAARHHDRFGFTMPETRLIVETATAEATGRAGTPLAGSASHLGDGTATAVVDAVFAGSVLATQVYARDNMAARQQISGPAIISDTVATTLVEPGWQAVVAQNGELILERIETRLPVFAVGTKVDPVMLEVFNNLFMSIAEQMGLTLQNTAISVNIKERLDFSCAIFDASGNLVANAPHMPVHLGSMSESVRVVIAENGDSIKPGDVIALNAPYNGGTHLPDVTVITPVFDKSGGRILFYVGSRGHHADIGGLTPGSMPADSVTTQEEGVLIDNFKLVEDGQLREAEMRALLAGGPYPARDPDRNIGDLKAQIAANEKGAAELGRMVAHFGLDTVQAYMGHVQDNAEEQVRRVIDVLSDGEFCYGIDSGGEVRVKVTIDAQARSATVDFAGTSGQLAGNFNAPSAVCRAAVLYVFRTLVDDDIPLNEGCLKPLNIIIPEGSMLAPRYPAAVVAGNVETCQVITDALYGALKVMAAAQGTMNNVTFGNAKYQYYETICGGSGAGPDFDGTSAVHTHMTNSRLTDPEILETRFPVLLESFGVRACSGGAGTHRGGDGVVRRIRFFQDMEVSILANRREIAPYGMAGGAPGTVGRNFVERADGSQKKMGATGRTKVGPGDVLVVETPGGGGYGKA